MRVRRVVVSAPDGASNRDDAPGSVKGPGAFYVWGQAMINVGIYGVTGYAGYELLRWIGRQRWTATTQKPARASGDSR